MSGGGGGDSIAVVVKVRPLLAREAGAGEARAWRVGGARDTLLQVDPSGRDTQPLYKFDKVYDEETKTSDVYDDIAKPIVEAAMAGINGTIFAYGQTSSGKTYTMMGDDQSPGIIPLAIHDIFNRIKNIPNRDFLLRVSYIEIYNETIKDLLNIEKQKIKISETLSGSVKVDATEKVTSSPDEVLEIMKQGEVNRQVGATNMNEKSSRSHTIFQITIESREHTEAEDDTGCVNVSQLNLVDLAGSERAGQTGATGVRFKEGTHINKSLSALGLVIMQLSEDPHKYVNYRDSKLTRILQNSLGGNAKTSIICAVTPAAIEETISTLQFASRAKAIKNKPEVNAVATDATMLKSLTKKLASLQYELDNKKHLEHDNVKLMKTIEQLQKQIMFGIEKKRDNSRRKTWCAPRRATISTIHDNDTLVIPAFCTPTLKYNIYEYEKQQNMMSNRPSDIPEGDEDAPETSHVTPQVTPSATLHVTPPQRKKTVYFTDEIIELGDSDDDVATEKTCSPDHKCYNSSKTPPCILRKKAKCAEKDYKELVEFTELEKIYTPTTVVPCNLVKTTKTKIQTSNLRQPLVRYKKPPVLPIESKKKTQNTSSGKPNPYHGRSSVELMDALNKSRREVILYKDQLEVANEKSTKKDQEIVALQDKLKINQEELETVKEHCNQKVEEIINLNNKFIINKNELEIANQLCTQKDKEILDLKDKLKDAINIEMEMESMHAKIIDLEVSLDIVKTKAKQREVELLSLLDEKNYGNIPILEKHISPQRPHDIELSTFMNLSRDISLIDSDAESSVVQCSVASHTITNNKDELHSLQLQLIEKNELIKELYHKVANGQQSIQICNEELETSNSTISSLKNMIDNLNLKLQKAERDNEYYERTVDDLNNKILDIDKENQKVKDSYSDLVKNEKNIVSNNKEISKVLDNLKRTLKEKEIESPHINCAGDCHNVIADKDKKIAALEDEISEIKLIVNRKLQDIQDLTDIKEELLIKTEILGTENTKLSQNLNTLTNEVEKIKNDLNKQELLVSSKNEEIKELEEQKEETKNIIKDQLELIDKHLYEKQALEKEYNMLMVDMDKAGAQLSKQMLLIKQAVENEAQINEENAQFKKKLKEKTVELDQTYALYEESTQKLNEEVKYRNEFQNKINDLERCLKQDSVKLSEKDAHIKELVIDEKMYKITIEEMKEELEQKLRSIEEAEIAIFTLKKEVQCLQEDEKSIQNLLENNNNLVESLRNKEIAIDTLKFVINEKEAKLSEAMTSINNLRQEHEAKDIFLTDMKNKTIKLLESIIESPCANVDCFSDILDTLTVQINLIKLHKHDSFYALEIELISCKKIMDSLQSQLHDKEKNIVILQTSFKEQSEEISKLQDLNYGMNKKFLEYGNLIKIMKQEITAKTAQIEELSAKFMDLGNYASSKIDQYDNSIIMLEEKHNLIQEKLPKKRNSSVIEENLKEDHQINEYNKSAKMNPASLCQLSLQKITEQFIIINNTKLANKNIQTTVDGIVQADVIKKDLLTKVKELTEKVEDLVNKNHELESDKQQANQELKLLLELSEELHKQILKYRTNLSTLTATTYAEIRLLKSKVKALQHHHNRHQKVCDREIPSIMQQLQELYLILQSELTQMPSKVMSIRHSTTSIQNLTNDSPESCNEISLSKFSSNSQGSDMLMLGDNFTIGPSANSTMIDTNDASNITLCVNLDVTEILKGVDTGCQTDENIVSNLLSCCLRTNQSEFNTNVYAVELMQELKIHSDSCIMRKELQRLKNEVEFKIKTSDEQLEAIKALEQEKLGLRDRINIIENKVFVKDTEIKNMDKIISNLKKEIQSLQTENDTLSTDIMDGIIEMDSLKETLKGLEEQIAKYELDTSSKEAAIKSLQENQISVQEMTNKSLETTLVNTKNLQFKKICSLQKELVASSEECKRITEDFADINEQLLKNQEMLYASKTTNLNPLPMENISHFDKEILGNISFNTNKLTLHEGASNELSVCSNECLYVADKKNCLKFLDEQLMLAVDEFKSNTPIIDIMKFLYNSLLIKHSNEVENFINKLKDFEEDKVKFDVQIKSLNAESAILKEDLKHELEYHRNISEQLKCIQLNNAILKEKCCSLDKLDDIYSNCMSILSTSMLEPIDNTFSLATSDIFKTILSSLYDRYQVELSKSNSKCSVFEKQINSLTEELRLLNERLVSIQNDRLDQNENELNLLKAKYKATFQISRAVTLDLIIKEKRINEAVSEKYQTLISKGIISQDDMDVSLSPTQAIHRLFDHIVHKQEQDLVLKETCAAFEADNKRLIEDLIIKREELEEIKQHKALLHEEIITLSTELKIKEAQAQKSIDAKIEESDSIITKLKEDGIIQIQINYKLEEEIRTLKNCISDCENRIVSLEKEAEELKNENCLVNSKQHSLELQSLQQLKEFEKECSKLRLINTELIRENSEYARKLEIGAQALDENKKELEKMILRVAEIQQNNDSLLASVNDLKSEITKKNEHLNEKHNEVTRLETNIKTHQKTADIQATMFKRLQKEKGDIDTLVKEKANTILELTNKCEALHAEVSHLNGLKDVLECRVRELQVELEGSQKSGRSSVCATWTESRRRRQSLYDLQRSFANTETNGAPDEEDGENIFASRVPPEDLFAELTRTASERKSKDSDIRDHRSADSTAADSDVVMGTEASAGDTPRDCVTERRRRRQSIHDMHRSAILDCDSNENEIEDLQKQNNKFTEEIHQLKSTIEDGPSGDYYKSEVDRLKSELESSRKQYEELSAQYKELDEECETCASYLREARDQCLELSKAKKALEHQVSELKKHSEEEMSSRQKSSNTRRQSVHDAHRPSLQVHVGVNTEADWASLRTVVVDRMSFDAEVAKNKKLTKTLGELRNKYEELKRSDATQHYTHSEVESLKSELESSRKQYEELSAQYKELDEECDTCASYLREREHQCLELSKAKKALEAKILEMQESPSSPLLLRTRKKRQSIYDSSRETRDRQTADAATNTQHAGGLSLLGIDHLTYEAERAKCHKLQGVADELKFRNMELTKELRRLQLQLQGGDQTVSQLQHQHEDVAVMRVIEELQRRKDQLEQQVLQLMSAPPSPACPTLAPPVAAVPILVATGSAIVQNQQICDLMKENQKLKRTNSKLMELCRKRNKLECNSNRENEEPC